MNKTINQLSDLTQVENDDELVVWDITAGTSKKAKARQFKNIFISATSTTVTGAGIVSGDVVKIMFTSAITGSDTTTGMSISYNGTSIPVKVGKQGSLVDFVAHDISGTYTYLQAYTTLELAFDGTQFVVIGNPVVLSSDDYTIYADGKIGDDSIGALISLYKKSNPYGYLFCDGRDTTGTDDELQTHYPSLYAYLGDSNILPDYRECVMVGAEQNTTDSIASHDVYTEGQFKDDQTQKHYHTLKMEYPLGTSAYSGESYAVDSWRVSEYGGVNKNGVILQTSTHYNGGRSGDTTHGKQKAVYVYIKAK